MPSPSGTGNFEQTNSVTMHMNEELKVYEVKNEIKNETRRRKIE